MPCSDFNKSHKRNVLIPNLGDTEHNNWRSTSDCWVNNRCHKRFKCISLAMTPSFHAKLISYKLITSDTLKHIFAGVLDAVKQSRGNNDRGVFLLAETSAVGSLIDSNYTKETVKLALEYSDLVVGLVCQSPLLLDTPGCIQLTPGVQLGTGGDNLGQQYNSPELVVLERGADIAVVGRGITQADNPEVAAEKYKRLLWEAYLKRIK